MARVFCVSGTSTRIRKQPHPGGFRQLSFLESWYRIQADQFHNRKDIAVAIDRKPRNLKFKGTSDKGFHSRHALGASLTATTSQSEFQPLSNPQKSNLARMDPVNNAGYGLTGVLQ
ncbi:hypothetical protein EAF04_007033 [Stromatinia cepivora]|nr:hypothetical protein EAF04_007033 [Stromatinia cepivora]